MLDNETHIGGNIKRLRRILDMKQEVFADLMTKETGEAWSQQRVSLLENRPDIDVKLLDQVAKVLSVAPDVIKNLDEDSGINVFNNTFNDNAVNNSNFKCTLNPIEVIVEQAKKNEELYKRLLTEKDERIRLLEKMIGK